MSFNDQKHCGLLALTGELSGHINDLEHLLLSSNVATPPTQINDMWHTYWDDQGIAKAHFNDRADEWLSGLGYSGSLSDKWYAFWTDACNGDIGLGLQAIAGWTGFENCEVPLVLHMVNDSYIDVPVLLDRDNPGRIEFDVKVDDLTDNVAVLDSQDVDRAVLMTRLGNTARARIFSISNVDLLEAFQIDQWHRVTMAWEGVLGGITNYAFDGNPADANTQTTSAMGLLRIGDFNLLNIGLRGYIKNVRIYNDVIGGDITHDYRIDDGSPDSGSIKNYADPSGATDGVLTLGANSSWETQS